MSLESPSKKQKIANNTENNTDANSTDSPSIIIYNGDKEKIENEQKKTLFVLKGLNTPLFWKAAKHSKELGNEILKKNKAITPDLKKKLIESYREVAGSQIANHITGGLVPVASLAVVDRMLGIAQSFINLKSFENNEDTLDKMSLQQLEMCLVHWFADKVISNYDAHFGNFAVKKEGTSEIIGLDKGQAFRFFYRKIESDKLGTPESIFGQGSDTDEFNLVLYGKPEINFYQKVINLIKAKKLKINFESPLIKDALKRCSELTPETIVPLCRDFAEVRFPKEDERKRFYNHVAERANAIPEKFKEFVKTDFAETREADINPLEEAWEDASAFFAARNDITKTYEINGIKHTFYHLHQGTFLVIHDGNHLIGNGHNGATQVMKGKDRSNNECVIREEQKNSKTKEVEDFLNDNINANAVLRKIGRPQILRSPDLKAENIEKNKVYYFYSKDDLIPGKDLETWFTEWSQPGSIKPTEMQKLQIALACLKEIQNLHENYGIAHNDIHQGQFIMEALKANDEPKITVIDFDKSVILNKENKLTAFEHDYRKLRWMLVSNFQLDCIKEKTPADCKKLSLDLFRTVLQNALDVEIAKVSGQKVLTPQRNLKRKHNEITDSTPNNTQPEQQKKKKPSVQAEMA